MLRDCDCREEQGMKFDILDRDKSKREDQPYFVPLWTRIIPKMPE